MHRPRSWWRLTGSLAAFAAGLSAASAQETVEFSGFVGTDLRIFAEGPAFPGQAGGRLVPSLVAEPELNLEWNDGDDRITVLPYLRFDARDNERSHVDLREAKYLHVGDDWDLRLGIDKLFWGVTEARHLVDIVNQDDAVEDIDGEDKLGQPMVNLGLQRDWGDLNLIWMPYFRERSFPGEDGRLRGALPVDTDRARYDTDLGRWYPDVAVRYTTVIDDYDIGLSVFHGTGREPRLTVDAAAPGGPVLVPNYDTITQLGVDFQATIEEWLWKFEGIYRRGQGDPFGALVAGVEYTFFGAVAENGDLGVLFEYLYDGRDATAPLTNADDDLFFGMRLTLNDIQDTNFLAGVAIDRVSGARSVQAEFDRRLGSSWKIEADLRLFGGLTEDDPFVGLRRDNHLQIRLARYF